MSTSTITVDDQRLNRNRSKANLIAVPGKGIIEFGT